VAAVAEQQQVRADRLGGGEAAEAGVVGEELVGGDEPEAPDPPVRGRDLGRGRERTEPNPERRVRGGGAGAEREKPRQKSEGPPA
jgi:hypothetical protein